MNLKSKKNLGERLTRMDANRVIASEIHLFETIQQFELEFCDKLVIYGSCLTVI